MTNIAVPAANTLGQPPKRFKHFIFGLIILVGLAALAYLLVPSNDQRAAKQTSQPSYIQTEPTLPPVSQSRTIIQKKNEYRPTTNPMVVDAYCKNYYEKDVYTYQYLGQTDTAKPTVSCI